MTKYSSRRKFLEKAGKGLLCAPLLASSVSALATTAGNGTRPAGQERKQVRSNTALEAGQGESKRGVRLDIRDFGAKGDGSSKDTAAIQRAIDRCSVLGGGVVTVPVGNFLTGALALRSHVELHLESGANLVGSSDLDDYPVSEVRWEGKWIPGHTALIYARDCENISITGPGKISGSRSVGGRPSADRPLRRPALIEPISCTNLRFDGFSTDYHLMWSIHPTYCDNIHISNLTIRSTGGNGDGIDIDSCKHVIIERCDISTGDDCISLKSGRGMEGYALLKTTEDVVIRDCTFADSIFACIGIGSETSGGIRDVKIENCNFTYAKTHAIYIKSRPGRGAFIENIDAENLKVGKMEGGFLRFNILGSGLQDQVPVPGAEGIPTIRNFSFSNVKVEDVPVLVEGTSIHPRKPLDGFVLANVTGTCRKGITLANIKNARLKDIKVSGFAGPLLSVNNVSGSGLKDAVQIAAPKVPEEIKTAETPYVLQ